MDGGHALTYKRALASTENIDIRVDRQVLLGKCDTGRLEFLLYWLFDRSLDLYWRLIERTG